MCKYRKSRSVTQALDLGCASKLVFSLPIRLESCHCIVGRENIIDDDKGTDNDNESDDKNECFFSR